MNMLDSLSPSTLEEVQRVIPLSSPPHFAEENITAKLLKTLDFSFLYFQTQFP